MKQEPELHLTFSIGRYTVKLHKDRNREVITRWALELKAGETVDVAAAQRLGVALMQDVEMFAKAMDSKYNTALADS